MIALFERIEYVPASDEPLSADVIFVHGDRYEWIFDVGNNEESRKLIEAVAKPKKIILSHFHEDHSGNLSRITYDEAFLGRYAAKKFGMGTVTDEKVTFYDGVTITVFPLPSSHAKGSLGMAVGDLAFLGDGTYPCVQTDETSGLKFPAYRVSVLKQTLDVLSALPVNRFFLSHDTEPVKNREDVIGDLKTVWNLRNKGNDLVFLR